MSIEQAVKARHEFEDRVREFLQLASLLTDRELELALGRLLDMISGRNTEQFHVQLRGEILKHYYDLRKQGLRRQRRFTRWQFKASSDYYVAATVEFWLLPDTQFAPPPSPSHIRMDEMVKLLTA